MSDYSKTTAAAKAAAGAAVELLRAACEEDAVSVSEVMTNLCNALVLVYETCATDDDAGQVAAAATKYLAEFGEDGFSI